ncbi:MAG: hypothetical protein KatS3mg012_0650 [Gaiellaceae bacterium]|nr:MAG: hypothetical protein KatS3mg012_0650 [Gaiellaceae bacterium]
MPPPYAAHWRLRERAAVAVHEIFRSIRDAAGVHYCAILLLGIFLVLIAMLVVLA